MYFIECLEKSDGTCKTRGVVRLKGPKANWASTAARTLPCLMVRTKDRGHVRCSAAIMIAKDMAHDHDPVL